MTFLDLISIVQDEIKSLFDLVEKVDKIFSQGKQLF